MIYLNLLQKEWLEVVRSYKILFIPVVFILLGVGQPLAMHFMPQILELGNVPAGTVIEIPIPPPEQIQAGIIDQYSQLGIFVLILAAMGVISREVEQGQAALLSTLGVTRHRYVLTKWMMLAALTVFSILIGFVATAYYTEILFGSLNWGHVILGALVYSLYPLFVLSLTLLLGTLNTSQLSVAGSTLATVIVFSLAGTMRQLLPWLPNQASTIAKNLIGAGQALPVRGIAVPCIWIAVTLVATCLSFRRREL
ncbi:MAG TPA: ABC transporter permease subunit [Firmicutes bacterium]|nr:ABC transporter permease subunit [Bacillota bacterium]